MALYSHLSTMDTTLACTISGFVYMMIFFKQGAASVSVCKDTSLQVINLTCSNTQMIHVISETYGNKGQELTCLNTSNSCTKSITGDNNGLEVNCNGKQSCNETYNKEINDCNLTSIALEIEYECAEESTDICCPVNKSINGSVHLHSPGFPESAGVNDSCHCEVTGSVMTVAVLEHRACKGVVTISTDNTTTWSSPIINYNRVITNHAGSALLHYDNHNKNNQTIWIKVTDIGEMDVTCWKGNAGPTTANPGSSSTTNSTATSGIQSTESQTSITTDNNFISSTQPAITSTDEIKYNSSSETASLSANTATQAVSSAGAVTGESEITKPSSSVASPTEAPPSDDNAKDDQPDDTSLPIPVIAGSAAAGGVLLAVIVVVIVVLCRRKNESKDELDAANTYSEQMGSLRRKTEASEQNKQFKDRIYFELDPSFDNAEYSTDVEETNLYNGQYAKVLPRNSRVAVSDNSTFKPGEKQANTQPKTLMDKSKEPENTENIEEGMVDNFLYHTFRQNEDDASSDHSQHGGTDKEEGMVMNDLYHSYKHLPPSEDPLQGAVNNGDGRKEGVVINDLYHSYKPLSVTEESHQGKRPNRKDDNDDSRKEGMAINDLYHTDKSEESHLAERYTSDIQNDNDDDGNGGMVINDLYHSYQPSSDSGTPDKGGESTSRSEEENEQPHMVDNDLYHSNVRPGGDGGQHETGGGHYEDIEDDELCVSSDSDAFDPKPRPAAYEEIADFASV